MEFLIRGPSATRGVGLHVIMVEYHHLRGLLHDLHHHLSFSHHAPAELPVSPLTASASSLTFAVVSVGHCHRGHRGCIQNALANTPNTNVRHFVRAGLLFEAG